MRRWTPTVVVALALAIPGGSAAADPQKILSDGSVQRIRLEPWPPGGDESGTVLRHVMQAPDGVVTIGTVTGTDDEAVERTPVLEVDPNDNSLLLVWVREEAGISELRISRYRGGRWSDPVPVTGARAGSASPRMAVSKDWIHLLWTEPSGGTRAPWRGVFRHDDFGIAFGPELLPRNLDSTGVSGGSGTGPDWSQIYLSLLLPGWFPGSGGTVHVWGIRDEPVPIGYHQGHALPGEVRDVLDLDAGWIGGSLTYWFHDPVRFVYRSYRKGTWGPFRMAVLDDQTSPEAAELQMIEMLRRR